MAANTRSELDTDLGFQIAPMIDVIFVIMLFFMTQAGQKQVETELKMKLPTTEPSDDMSDTPMEEQISIDEEGNIAHNEEPVDPRELMQTFKTLKEQSKAEGGTPIIVTISSAPDTKWEKVATVMDAMYFAGIENVSFTVEDDF